MSVEISEVQAALGCSHAEAVALVETADRIDGELQRQLVQVAELRAALGFPTVEVGALVRVPCHREQLATVTEESPEGGRWRLVWFDGRATRVAWWDTASLVVVASPGDVRQLEDDRADAAIEVMRP